MLQEFINDAVAKMDIIGVIIMLLVMRRYKNQCMKKMEEIRDEMKK